MTKWDQKSAFEQLEKCGYECQGGPLHTNAAYQWLKENFSQWDIPSTAPEEEDVNLRLKSGEEIEGHLKSNGLFYKYTNNSEPMTMVNDVVAWSRLAPYSIEYLNVVLNKIGLNNFKAGVDNQSDILFYSKLDDVNTWTASVPAMKVITND